MEPASEGRLVEIACDESGYEGEKLVGGTTDVFAHGSVRMEREAAAECMRQLRERIRSPATEYKANHLLRQKHRAVLQWLLGPAGPLLGNAHVCLIDKSFLVVVKLVELIIGRRPSRPVVSGLRGDRTVIAVATEVYHQATVVIDRESWQVFLVAANELMRAKDRLEVGTPVERFLEVVGQLYRPGLPQRLDEILARLARSRPRAQQLREELVRSPHVVPALDPLIPAIVRAVGRWGADDHGVAVTHDRQNTLSPARIDWLLAHYRDDTGRAAGHLASLRLSESFSNPRIQVADIIAGVARKIASEELNGRTDPVLARLLRPYLDPASIWVDRRSWNALRPLRSCQPV